MGFIKIGKWLYPLVPGESPGMKTSFNAYIFPNEDDELNQTYGVESHFVGITFEQNTKNNEQILLFEDILANYGCLTFQEKETNRESIPTNISKSASNKSLNKLKINDANYKDKNEKEIEKRPYEANTPKSGSNLSLDKTKIDDSTQKPKENKQKELEAKGEKGMSKTFTAENIAETIISGAQYLSNGLATGSEYASKYLQQGSDKLKSQLEPSQEPVKVNYGVKTVVSGIRYTSNATVKVSSFAVKKLGSLAAATARTVAPHIRKGSTALLTKTGIVSNEATASGYVDGICTVTTSSLQGFSMVYDSIEDAAKALGRNLTEQTVTVVGHK